MIPSVFVLCTTSTVEAYVDAPDTFTLFASVAKVLIGSTRLYTDEHEMNYVYK